jgi:hypothetical protein
MGVATQIIVHGTKTFYMEDKIFANGFSFKRNEKAPDFVVGRMSIKVADAISFMKEHEKNGYINLNVKTARSGNHYVELDTFEPSGGSKPKASKPEAKPQVDDDDIPF